MITANLAGSASSSKVRAQDRTKDSNCHSSRLNLPDSLESEIAAAEASLSKYKNDAANKCDEGRDCEAAKTEAKRLRNMIREYRRRKCMRDYQACAYLTCVGLVLLIAIVLIILAASGIISPDGAS